MTRQGLMKCQQSYTAVYLNRFKITGMFLALAVSSVPEPSGQRRGDCFFLFSYWRENCGL